MGRPAKLAALFFGRVRFPAVREAYTMRRARNRGASSCFASTTLARLEPRRFCS